MYDFQFLQHLVCLSLAFELDSLSTLSNCRPYLFRSRRTAVKPKKTWECIIRMLPNNKSGVEESSKMIAAERESCNV